MKRFWEKVEINNPFLCWEWKSCINDTGYGAFSIKGKRYNSHRLAYEFVIGQIPQNLTIDHLCKNRSCVNPFHMEPVTLGENVRRGKHKKFCKRGHERNSKNVRVDNKDCRACVKIRNLGLHK